MAKQIEIIPLLTPTLSTLKKYGLSVEEWRVMADEQGEACYVCKQKPTKGRLCIDHEHVKGWKKMPPHQRKIYVRGLLCFRCNTTFVGRGVTVERSRNVTAYLEHYEILKTERLSKDKNNE
jgi:hypothetical protein